MSSDEKTQKSIISQTRFLIVESDPKISERFERYLLLDGAMKVYVAQKPLTALRILQDKKTPVDCVICAHRTGFISGLAFLTNLRAGRWGGGSMRRVKFLFWMPKPDQKAIEIADRFLVDGYIFGEPDRVNVRTAILKAIQPANDKVKPPNLKVAHLRAHESDLIVVPFPASFATLPVDQQQLALQAVAVGAEQARLNGSVAAVWPSADGGTAFMGAPRDHRFLSKLTPSFVTKLCNQAIFVEWMGCDPTADTPEQPTTEQPREELRGTPAPAVIAAPAEDDLERRHLAAGNAAHFQRSLTQDDMRKVLSSFKDMGPETFIEKFVRFQPVVRMDQASNLTPLLREYFVSIAELRSAIFPETNLRGARNAFRGLTVLLDQLMLQSLPMLSRMDQPYSLNINIQSILTKTFEQTLKKIRPELLTVEISQPTITSYFEEFKAARQLIISRGGKIAVDQIFPDTIGLVNFEHVSPKLVKLNWKGEMKHCDAAHRDFVKKTLDSGIDLVLSRVDDPVAFEIAATMGIDRFQGFLIDELTGVNSAAELKAE